MSKTSPTLPMWGGTQPSSLNTRYHSAGVETLWTINLYALEAERQLEWGGKDNSGGAGPRPTERVGGQTQWGAQRGGRKRCGVWPVGGQQAALIGSEQRE